MSGRSRTLVLLPGMMCDARLFAPQIEAFGQTHDIVVPLLFPETGIDAVAERILDEVRAPAFSLAGLSMGGIVAIAMAHLAPDRIERLALLDTNHLADAPERFAIRNRQMADARAGRLREVMTEEMKPAYLGARHREDRALLGLLMEMALDLGPDVFVAQSLALRDRPGQAGRLAGYRGPTLLLCGAQDSLCPPHLHRAMCALLQRGRFEEVPEAGHISTLENPARVNAAMREWLGS